MTAKTPVKILVENGDILKTHLMTNAKNPI